MTKQQFIIIGITLGVITVFLIILIWILQIQKTQLENPVAAPTAIPTLSFTNDRQPTEVPTVTVKPQLAVVKTDPADKASNVSTNGKLIIVFNRDFSINDMIFSIAPDVKYKLTIIGKTLQVAFPQGLQPSTFYTYKINTLTQLPRTYTFSTTGENPVQQPNTYPEGAREIEEEYQRQNNPDIYLRNKTPYEHAQFSVNSIYDEEQDIFIFTVTTKIEDKDLAKESFLDWLLSLGLKQEQVDQLDITYE